MIRMLLPRFSFSPKSVNGGTCLESPSPISSVSSSANSDDSSSSASVLISPEMICGTSKSPKTGDRVPSSASVIKTASISESVT